MSWNIPITWDHGRLVTPGDLNEQIRDNLSYLYAHVPNVQSVTASGVFSTSSASWVAVSASLDLTVTTGSGLVMVGFVGHHYNNYHLSTAGLRVSINGQTYILSDLGLQTNATEPKSRVVIVDATAPGTYTASLEHYSSQADKPSRVAAFGSSELITFWVMGL